MTNLRHVATAAFVVVVAGDTIVKCVRIHKKGIADRDKIQKESLLNREAIRRAAEVVKERMNEESYMRRGVENCLSDLDNEIAFQKIIIREAK